MERRIDLGKLNLSFDKIPTPFATLLDIWLIWSCQVRFESMYTPKNLTLFEGTRGL